MTRRRGLAIGVVLSCACAAGAKPRGESPTAATGEVAHQPASTRMSTAPGLCVVTEQDQDEGGSYARLELSYDAEGRIAAATGFIRAEQDACLERQDVTWRRDDHGRLVEVVHSLDMREEIHRRHAPEPCTVAPELSCWLEGGPHVVERNTWQWTADGQLRGWTQTYDDCEGSETDSETLRVRDELVEVASASDGRVERYRVDEHGRVVELVGRRRHRYDAFGRLIETTPIGKPVQRWSYAASAVGSPGGVWEQRSTRDTIVLAGPGELRIVIRLDASGRPSAVETDTTSWVFEYGGCRHAERASQRWWLDGLVAAWPWPETPHTGSGAAALEAWSSLSLPHESLGP